jgi:hypothetical protein
MSGHVRSGQVRSRHVISLTFVEALLVADVAVPELDAVLPALGSEFFADQLPDPFQTFLRRVVEVIDDDYLVLVVGDFEKLEAGVRSDVTGPARH